MFSPSPLPLACPSPASAPPSSCYAGALPENCSPHRPPHPCLAASFSAFKPPLKHHLLPGALLVSPHLHPARGATASARRVSRSPLLRCKLDSEVPDGQDGDCFAGSLFSVAGNVAAVRQRSETLEEGEGGRGGRGSMEVLERRGSSNAGPGRDPGTTWIWVKVEEGVGFQSWLSC